MKWITLIGVLAILIFPGCKKNTEKFVGIDWRGNAQSLIQVADSIKYEVIVQPLDDDIWDQERLIGYQNHHQLITKILNAIMEGKLTAYDYASDEPLTIEEVGKIVKNNNIKSEQIGKILFTEQWFMDKNGYLYKKVTAITLGKAEYSKQGTFKGYSALFKIKYPPRNP